MLKTSTTTLASLPASVTSFMQTLPPVPSPAMDRAVNDWCAALGSRPVLASADIDGVTTEIVTKRLGVPSGGKTYPKVVAELIARGFVALGSAPSRNLTKATAADAERQKQIMEALRKAADTATAAWAAVAGLGN